MRLVRVATCFTGYEERSWTWVNKVRFNLREVMKGSIETQINQLRKLPARALRIRYRELFGEDSRSGNRQFLFRRVAWRLQAKAEGDLSERARKRAAEIANDADLRVQPPKKFLRPAAAASSRDPRLPPEGTLLCRTFRGRAVEVKVLDRSFEYEGRSYQSLSAIASEVTGTRWNGFAFFQLPTVEGKHER